ncbi:MAG: Smr/MutS family protein [Alphaproteobacteria bacterium]|nr:Smr/MutS family protein [Alphaproteobacteria bacterium]
MKNQPPEIKDDDSLAWTETLKNVRRLPQPEEPPSAPIYIEEVTPTISYKNIPNIYQLSYLHVGDLSNMDGQTARRMKRCEYKIEATLDLHGKTETQAYDNVFNFIKQAYLQNKRCVLIITGKGLNQNADDDIFSEKGKLKERTPVWLNSEQLRPLILGFIHPTQNLGGTGALYILLRKNK